MESAVSQLCACFNPENWRRGITQVLQRVFGAHATVGIAIENPDRGTPRAMSIFKRDKTFTQPIIWVTTLFMIAFHVGAIAALFFFTWKRVALAGLFLGGAGSLGIRMAYHRVLTHRAYT